MVIILNGSINSGKSTVAKILWKKIPSTAHIEVDKLREFVDWMSLKDSIPINLENTISLIKNFTKKDLNVVITYPLSQKNYEYLIENLKDIGKNIYTFTLNPELKKTTTNRGTRELNEWEKERIKYHYHIGINNPSFGITIDNTDQSPEETAEIILNYITKEK